MNIQTTLIKRIPWSILAAIFLLFGESSRAEVVRFEIQSRDLFAQGESFGQVGPYERIVGRVHYEIDPSLRQNQNVVDLGLAPKNERGQVEFSGDLFVLAPKNLSKASGALLYDVNNRGNKLALRFFNFADGSNNPTTSQHAGDGFLMRNGFIILWSGWDGELLPGNDRLRLSPPVANGDRPITGLVRCEIVPTGDTTRTVVNWANHGSYRPTRRGIQSATLTHRVRAMDPRVIVRRDEWTLHVNDVESDSPHQLPKVELEIPKGLKRGHVYELIYEARDPLVHGTCFTGLRDLVSAFKHGHGQNNPLILDGTPAVRRAHAFGVSQSGRFLREFLHAGFNEDEQTRKVFDGLIPHVSGAGLGSFNHRFAQPTRHVTQHDHHDYPADRFPFSYETQYDPLSGQTDGILKRATDTKTTPFVLHTQSTAEYWTRSGSLAHTDPLGHRDSDVPQNVRIYLFGGTQHGPSSFPPSCGSGQNRANPADYRPFLRALLLGLDRWVRDGLPVPSSVYPTVRGGTLVDWQQPSTGFPNIPGVRYPQIIQQPSCWDYGPRWWSQKIVDRQPPGTYGDYRVLVPACDLDGNQLDCLSPPEVSVPIATYTGWNLRSKAAGAENELVSLGGSFIPFPLTKTRRDATQDPRRSVEERYPSLDAFLTQLAATCGELRDAGFLLDEDVERTLRVQRERVEPLFEAIGLAGAAARVQQIVAHRGASLQRPECTLSAIRRAMEVGATAIEMDVRTSQDGVLFLLHDATLDRTTNGAGPANELTIAQLQKLDAGSWFDTAYRTERIPTLQDALQICRGRARVLLDLKESGDPYAQKVAEVVRRFGSPSESIIGVRGVEQARRFRKLLPEADQLGLIPDPVSIESFANAGVETIRLWPRWIQETDGALVQRVKKSNCRLHLNGSKGSLAEVVPLLSHRPDSISADDPAILSTTLNELKNAQALSLQNCASEQPKSRVPLARRRAGTAIILHRGAVDHAVENTLSAIEAAFATGGDGVEIDIRKSRDGVVILMHDPWVDRTLDAFGPLSEWTYDELLLYPFRDPYGGTRLAERVPTFDQVLEICERHSGLLHLDVKAAGIDERIRDQLIAKGMRDHVVTVNPNNSAAIQADVLIRPLRSQGSVIHGKNDYCDEAISSLLKGPKGTLLVDDARRAAALLMRPTNSSGSATELTPISQVVICPQTSEQLLRIARSPNNTHTITRRQALARLLGHFPETARPMFSAGEKSWDFRSDSDWLWAAGRYFARGENCHPRIATWIVDALSNSHDMGVLEAAAEAAGEAKLEQAISSLITVLDRFGNVDSFKSTSALRQRDARHIRVRAAAAKALGRIGTNNTEVVSTLRTVAAHRSLHTNGAYQGLDGAEAIKSLMAIDPQGHTELLRSIVLLVDNRLTGIETREDLPWWLRQSKTWWDFRIKTEALRGLGKQGTREARKVLEAFLALPANEAESIWRELHWDAARALCSTAWELGEQDLRRLLAHPTAAVRRTAAAYRLAKSAKE